MALRLCDGRCAAVDVSRVMSIVLGVTLTSECRVHPSVHGYFQSRTAQTQGMCCTQTMSHATKRWVVPWSSNAWRSNSRRCSSDFMACLDPNTQRAVL
eukprot:5176009-Amphidinium_carterae.3